MTWLVLALLAVALTAVVWAARRHRDPGEAERRRTAEERLQALERRNARRLERDDEERQP